MEHASTFNIIMYSHDTYGLGHLRRCMAIASHLGDIHTNILILTGSPIAGRFLFPDRVDFVRIPGMIKYTNEEYLPAIKISPQHALAIRRNIIETTVKTFQPDLFIVDKEPLGLKKEVLSTLRWLKNTLPKTKTVLGLRDIMDNDETVRKDWNRKGIYTALEKLYDEIWVYGEQEFYDPIDQYAFSDGIAAKTHFTGYLPRSVISPSAILKVRKEHGLRQEEKMIIVTVGGGGDGYQIMDDFLSMMETKTFPFPARPVLVTGPFMPKKQRNDIYRRGKLMKIKVHTFYLRMEELIAAADLVISMGGYNTTCEIMTQKRLSIVIPREIPRKEQLIRAQVFEKQNLSACLNWGTVTPTRLYDTIVHMVENSKHIKNTIDQFKMTGNDYIQKRVREFKNTQKNNGRPKDKDYRCDLPLKAGGHSLS